MKTLTIIEDILRRNHCNEEEFYGILHKTLLLLVLEQICCMMKQNPQKKNNVLECFRSFRDNGKAAQKIASDLVGVVLSEEESLWLSECLHAHFRKKPRRKPVDSKTKERLLRQQAGLCNCCKEPLALENSHYDHVIPWSLVGDELKDNEQLLCTPCNEHKSASITYLLKRQIVKKIA